MAAPLTAAPPTVTHGSEFTAAAGAGEQVSARLQRSERAVVGGTALALPEHAVIPVQSVALQAVQYRVSGARLFAWRVNIFNA